MEISCSNSTPLVLNGIIRIMKELIEKLVDINKEIDLIYENRRDNTAVYKVLESLVARTKSIYSEGFSKGSPTNIEYLQLQALVSSRLLMLV